MGRAKTVMKSSKRPGPDSGCNQGSTTGLGSSEDEAAPSYSFIPEVGCAADRCKMKPTTCEDSKREYLLAEFSHTLIFLLLHNIGQ